MRFAHIVGVLCLLCAMSASAQGFMQTLLKPFYPVYNLANQCQGVWANDGSYDGVTGETYQSGYCVDINAQYIVNTTQGKRLYLLTTGDVAFDEYGQESGGSHVQSGLVGMFVFKPKGEDWQIEFANPYMNAGSSGRAISEWQFVKLGMDTWGFVGEHSDVHYGVFESSKVILTPDGTGGIIDNWIGASHNDDSFMCIEAQGKQQPCDNIDATMIVETGDVVNGFYPLFFVVSGYFDGKTYDNRSYHITYQAGKGYVAPSNYPLKHDDW